MPIDHLPQLRGDTLCQGCGYNLRGQMIVTGSDLDFAICRCPECGRFHPAGVNVVPLKRGVRNLCGISAIVWVLMCIFGLCVASWVAGVAQYAYLETFTHFGYLMPDGRMVDDPGLNRAGSIRLRVPSTGNKIDTYTDPLGLRPAWVYYLPFVFFSVLFSLWAGCFIAIAFWKSSLRVILPMAAPFAIGAIVYSQWRLEQGVKYLFHWSILHLVYWALLDLTFLAIGLLVGRKIGRLGAPILLAPNLRQHAAVLWFADRKPMPPYAK
jgi:hypothetical protein